MVDFSEGGVFISNQANPGHEDKVANSNRVLQSKFRQFLREFRLGGVEQTFIYRDVLLTNYEQRDYQIRINLRDLTRFDSTLSEELYNHPSECLPLFELAAREVIAYSKAPQIDPKDLHPIQVQFDHFDRQMTTIRDLNSDSIGKLVSVPGIIISATKPSSKATRITLMCTNCRTTREIATSRAFGSIQLPRTCENSSAENLERKCPLDPFTILADQSSFTDIQRLKLQESPEEIPTGEMPRHMTLYCDRKLVCFVKPGSRVNVIGILKVFTNAIRGRESQDVSVRTPYIEVIGFEEMNVTQQKGLFEEHEEETFREIAADPDVYEKLATSIAPAIWGNGDIKKAVACLLFGGSRKFLPDGMRLRGDINVLLLGDPSVAKSQFLKFVHQVAPIAVYTSGKGSSAAGLTASVIKDPGTGEFHLEGGAMVLADGGVVCIDEFDKMREGDRVAIHEAMEQQTISIAKAGITTILNSRTSVLAAANPVFGRYDDMRSTGENIEFESTILSRFDLIFVIRDVKDASRDTNLAHHIMQLHVSGDMDMDEKDDTEAPIPADVLSKYISFARHRIQPRLSEAAAKSLKNHYVNFRHDAKTRQDETGEQSGIPLTVRQLESLIRLSESLARMQLSPEATAEHVREAVRLFQVSTIRAARGGDLSGLANLEGAAGLGNTEFNDNVKKAEKQIKRRVPIGTSVQISKIIRDLASRKIPERAVQRAIEVMTLRGEAEYRARRRQMYRKA